MNIWRIWSRNDVQVVFATAAAFATYSGMYMYRKSFGAATYSQMPSLWGVDYKSALVIAQVLGYMLSKFLGIKVISSLSASWRAVVLLGLVGFAQLALVGFAVVPLPWHPLMMFLNGIPLGMVWGVVFSYLEGKKYTEIMGLGLCASFIFASGFAKDAGRWVMAAGVSEFWMPAVVGFYAAVPFAVSVGLLSLIPRPTPEDERLRVKRQPMTATERKAYFSLLAAGLVALIVAYTLLTAYRDLRDNFMADIWAELGRHKPNFSATEVPVSVLVLLVLMALVWVEDNFRALQINIIVIGFGFGLVGASTLGFGYGWVDEYFWMLLTGLGTYIAYIPFNAILFERMIAAFGSPANAGFLIYLADSFGYLGSVSVLLFKNFGSGLSNWLDFFVAMSYGLAVVGLLAVSYAGRYFAHRKKELKI